MGHERTFGGSGGSSVTTHSMWSPPAAGTSRAVAATSPSRIAAARAPIEDAEAVRGDRLATRLSPAVASPRRIGQYGHASTRPAGPGRRPAAGETRADPLRGGGPSSTAPWTSRRRRSRHAATSLSRLCRNHDEVSRTAAEQPVQRGGGQGGRRLRSAASGLSTSDCTASEQSCGGLPPVGAASAIRSRVLPPMSACSASRASRRATVVVLPVPGPPVQHSQCRDSATSAAARYRRSNCRGTGGRRQRQVERRPAMRRKTSLATRHSSINSGRGGPDPFSTCAPAGRQPGRWPGTAVPLLGRRPRQLLGTGSAAAGPRVDAPIRRARPATSATARATRESGRLPAPSAAGRPGRQPPR